MRDNGSGLGIRVQGLGVGVQGSRRSASASGGPQKSLCGGIPDSYLEPLTRCWSHFVGSYFQKLTNSAQNLLLKYPHEEPWVVPSRSRCRRLRRWGGHPGFRRARSRRPPRTRSSPNPGGKNISEPRGNNLKSFKDFDPKAKARIRP